MTSILPLIARRPPTTSNTTAIPINSNGTAVSFTPHASPAIAPATASHPRGA